MPQLYASWKGMKPFLVHEEHAKDIWYSNDKDFSREIPHMSKTDLYLMRFAGWLKIPTPGVWSFKTNSDDGSMLYIDGKVVVDNDGLHGMRVKRGKADLSKGWHKLVITFYENAGFAGLQVSVGAPVTRGNSVQWKKLTAAMTKTPTAYGERDSRAESACSLSCFAPLLNQKRQLHMHVHVCMR